MTNKEAVKSLQNIVEYWDMRPTEQEAAKLAIKALEQQEKEQWIPVSDETNPKKSDIYLATFEENGNRYVERFYYSNFNGWLMPIPWQDEGHIDKMIAWRPLPEPYKEENDIEV
ncbi:hypothetical protein [Lacrimispora indolis]|uniref:hypothetical protein n=1 Tax=Lacrimispora indolis TaxID=69825 RepID=UPI000462CF35|nr:hypothetical protein [[Clostridium] methoxybenzovorans]